MTDTSDEICRNCGHELKPVPIMWGRISPSDRMREWGVAFGGCSGRGLRFACAACRQAVELKMGPWSARRAFLAEADRRHERGEISASAVEDLRAMYAPGGRD